MISSINKSERIRNYLAEGKLTPKEIATKVKVSKAYVYQIRWNANHKAKSDGNGGTHVAVQRANGHGHADVGVGSNGEQLGVFLRASQSKMGIEDPLVNHPPHYTMGKIETIDYIEAKQLGFLEGNVIKYVTRARHKGDEVRDLHKAMWYLQRAISEAETRGKHADA